MENDQRPTDRQRDQKRVRRRQCVRETGSRDGGRLYLPSPPLFFLSPSSTQPWEVLQRWVQLLFPLGSLRLIGWCGLRSPKISLLGAGTSALQVVCGLQQLCGYEVRLQEECWGLSSSFLQVSWGCRKSSAEQGCQELWPWFGVWHCLTGYLEKVFNSGFGSADPWGLLA